uniref:CRAL-TRIO domain-containing protein n=1 Tax=Globodera pallida TaxID=36090 RepID=A0A183C2T4_GLOPA
MVEFGATKMAFEPSSIEELPELFGGEIAALRTQSLTSPPYSENVSWMTKMKWRFCEQSKTDPEITS